MEVSEQKEAFGSLWYLDVLIGFSNLRTFNFHVWSDD